MAAERPAALREAAAAQVQCAFSRDAQPVRTAALATLPSFTVAVAEDPDTEITLASLNPPVLCGICVPLAPAQPAVREVQHRTHEAWQWPAAGLRLPSEPQHEAGALHLPVETAFAPTPAAQPVEVPLYCAACYGPLAISIEVRLPDGLREALERCTVPLAALVAIPEPESAEVMVQAGANLEIAAFAPEPIAEPVGMPEAALPVALPLAPTAAAAAAESAESVGIPSANFEIAAFAPALAAGTARLPEAAQMAITCAAAGRCEFFAQPAEALPQTAFAPEPAIAAFSLCYPAFAVQAEGGKTTVAEAGEKKAAAAAAVGQSVPAVLPLDWMSGTTARPVNTRLSAALDTAVPRSGFVALEFFCRRATSVPVSPLAWTMPKLVMALPPFRIAAIPPALDPPAAPPVRKRKRVLRMPGGRRRPSWLGDIAKPLAACFLVGAFLWLGATAMRVGTHTAAMNRDVATLFQDDGDSGAQSSGKQASSGQGPAASAASKAAAKKTAPDEQAPQGMMARVKHAIAGRAASQLTETFHEGMSAWSAGRKPGAPSWVHSPEGYVRPAAFALFRPSLDYRDYRVEFFGQIEQKSLSWAVRASDPKNYVGMKVSVVEPGMRPVVAVEHYAVVDGKKGHRTQVPLPEVMFHNNTPYRIEVAVRGNRVTTSIEGQEVDSWVDDLLPRKGGVALFAEGGERARVYWMKVARNEDFLGRICAYISGNDTSTIADLWPGTNPANGAPGPGGVPTERADIAFVSALAFRGSQRRRTASWSL